MKQLGLLAGMALSWLFCTPEAGAAPLKVLLPLGRAAYQTNEWIDVSVVRTSPDGLKQGPLVLTLAGPGGSKLDFTFTARAAEGKPAVASEHLHLNGWLLRPGRYTLEVAADGATAQARIEVYSHLRQSTFKVIDWGSRAGKHEQSVLGADSLGFNTMLYAYGGIDVDEMIRGGLDYMHNCVMGGWHYMDLRRECDWSDPYVLGGGIARASRQAFQDRVNPNCLGIHFYDEPMLAEVKDPTDPTGKRLVRYGVPAQERSYRAVFGKNAPRRQRLNFERPEDVRRWRKFNRWRLLLLEAAWKISCFSVNQVRPDYLPTSQNQWAWHAFDEGYYFNVNRPFPVSSRHAWYDYKHGGDFAPSFSFEFGRIRELTKPNWFLPMWGCGRSDLFRAEQYLSFINNLQGIAKAPDLLAHRPARMTAAQGLVESNKTMARLGTIFDTLPVTRAPLAVLYSMSHNLHEQTRGPVDSYRGNSHFQKLLYLYLASKILHTPLFPTVEEDVLDGSLARHHQAVVVAGVDYLAPRVRAGLEAFIAAGGSVLLSDDSRVKIKGATSFHLPLEGVQLNARMDQWAQDKQWGKWSESVLTNRYFKAAIPVARALEPKLLALGLKPVLDCDQPGVVVSRQAFGDIEYLFAVNASPDFATSTWYGLRTALATLGLPGDGRPVYDAVRGGVVEQFQKQADRLIGKFRFGPGQLRVFARTARPIGGVQVLTPLQTSAYPAARQPIRVEINAVLVDDQKNILCGSAPLHIEVTDPLKVKRYDLYRATDRGLLRLTLPLAANDPAGTWTVTVRELLSNRQGRATFRYRPPAQCGALAGATRRAVLFGRDRENIFRFFRTHKDLTIITGSGAFNAAAAERLAKSLDPWDIHCKVIAAADVKRRTLTAQEKPTWVDAGGAFALRGPAILLGNPDDNPLIRHLRDQKYLPYAPARDQFPGRGRGLLAWQRDGLAYFGHESLTLIAYDEAGLAEAVGTAYAIAAGLTPLTPRVLPTKTSVRPATAAPAQTPGALLTWQLTFPDRPVAMKQARGGLIVLTADGTLSSIKAGGLVAWQKTLDGGEAWALDVTRDGRLIVVGATQHLYAFDAGGKQLLDLDLGRQDTKSGQGNEGIGLVALSPDGARILVSFGRTLFTPTAASFSNSLSLVNARGEKIWSVGGLDATTGKPRITEHYRSALFSPDGKKIVVMAEKRAQVLDAATGKFGKALDGLNHPTALPMGADLLLSDGDSKLVRFAPTQEKILSQLDCGKAGPVTFALIGQGVVVGTEADGTVRLVKAVAGKLEEQTVWKDQAYTRIIKRVLVHGDRLAVIYWGGTVRVFDRGGKRLLEHVFAQDISAAAWVGSDLVAGLADGKIVAFQGSSFR